jgi:hypothetical protein
MLNLPDFDAMYCDMAKSAKIDRCHVLCRKCGATQFVDGARALREGWPKCCGETMMLGACAEKKS